MPVDTRPTGSPEVQAKGLRANALGLMSSVVMGVASTAPAYSLAATLGFVVIAVGVQAPAIMILGFLPILFVAFAYQELNRVEPDCGTTFTWATRAFGPKTGWMGGWGIVAADVIVMASLAQIAGQYGFLLFGADGLADSTLAVTAVGVLWIVAMTWVAYRGIEVSARAQYVLLAVEMVMLALYAGVALWKVYAGSAPDGSILPSLSWFNPFEIESLSAVAEGVLLAVFIYWGWDTAVAVNEETAHKETTPGRAAVLSTLLLVATYVLVSVSAQAFAGVGEEGIGLGNPDNAEDFLAATGSVVLGPQFNALLILSVLTSAAASTLTTILPTARGTLAMATYRAIPRSFAKVHPHYLTPTVSTVAMGAVSIAFYVAMAAISDNVLADSALSIGLPIAFYYGLTAITCVWYFRRDLRHGARDLWLKGIFPLVGGLVLGWAFVRTAIDSLDPDYGYSTFLGIGGVFVIGIGSLLIGFVIMLLAMLRYRPFFAGKVLTMETPMLVPEVTGVPLGLDLPDADLRRAPIDHLAAPEDIEPDVAEEATELGRHAAAVAETYDDIDRLTGPPPSDPERGRSHPDADDDDTPPGR